MNTPETPSRVDEPGRRPQDTSSVSRGGGSAPGLATTGALRRRHDIPIPLPGGARVFWIAASFPITDDEWDYVMHVLATMRPGLATSSTVPDHLPDNDESRGHGSVR